MKPVRDTPARRGRAGHPGGGFSLRGALSVAILVGMPVLGVVVLGCSEQRRYEVLSFFFDGVPPPGGVGAASRPSAEPNRPGSVELAERPIASTHSPYQRRRCVECHGEAGATSQSELQGGSLCRQCHADLFNAQPTDWVHAPAATGQCRFCHKPHESVELVLLTAPQPTLCLRCHEEGVLNKPYHAGATTTCTVCHDPHRAGNRLLIADSRSYARSKLTGKLPQVIHKPYADHQCDSCHQTEASNALKGEVNSLCRTCHAGLMRPPGERVHAPVRQGLCAQCHEAHESPLPHLLKAQGEKMCLSCHRLAEISGGTHPRVEQASCAVCHYGHSSPRGALLRPGIPSRRYPEAPPAGRPTPHASTAPASQPEGGTSR